MKSSRSTLLAFATSALFFGKKVQAQITDGPVDLSAWTPIVRYSGPILPPNQVANWDLGGTTTQVTQTVNSEASFYCSEFNTIGTGQVIEGTITPGTDDDFIGIALGFDAIDTTADYMLIDWKGITQGTAFGSCGPPAGTPALRGLALSRVTGAPTLDEIWTHTNDACNPAGGVQELARGTTLGSTSYDRTGGSHNFRIEYTASTLVVDVDGVGQFNVAGSFPNGRICFYEFGQVNVIFQNFEVTALSLAPSDVPSDVPSESQLPTCTNGQTGAGCGGDPHFRTFHGGKRFSWHGEGDMVLLSNAKFRKKRGLFIHGRSTIKKNKRDYYSIMEVVAIQIGTFTLEVSPNYHYINGVLNAELPIKVYGDIHVSKSVEEIKHLKRMVYAIDLAQDGLIKLTTFKDYVLVNVIDASEEEFSNSVGMFGTFHEGTLLARDGLTVIEDYDTLGDHWQVRNTEDPQLFYSLRAPQYPLEKPRMPPKEVQPSRRRLRATHHSDIEEAEEACGHRVVDNEQCIFDVLATGDVDLAIGGEF